MIALQWQMVRLETESAFAGLSKFLYKQGLRAVVLQMCSSRFILALCLYYNLFNILVTTLFINNTQFHEKTPRKSNKFFVIFYFLN